jgi:broad specificity phosphatase PhoE
MATVFFITHPDVLIDPTVPVPDWPLSPCGLARMRAMLAQPWIPGIVHVASSADRKARDGAAILAVHLGLLPVARAGLGENDRSATGYLPKPEFEATADAFFAHPEASVRGWERAGQDCRGDACRAGDGSAGRCRGCLAWRRGCPAAVPPASRTDQPGG